MNKNKLIALIIQCCFVWSFCITGCGANNIQAVDENVWQNPVLEQEQYDVIVMGTEPEGIAAAVSAARNGMKTLLLGEDKALGGLMTIGQLNFIDMCESRDGTILTQGFFKEFYDAVGGTAFDVEVAKRFFYDWVINEENATLKLNTAFGEPVMDGDTIVGVVVEENDRFIL